jgi:hypothetical protein
MSFEYLKSTIGRATAKTAKAYCALIAKYRAQNTYPDCLELDLKGLFTAPRQLRVAIIDDQPFPWVDALEARGCKVTVHTDYSKKITQANQKVKIIDFSGQDIIICDINGVGSNIYPGSEGISIIEDLRKKNPLHVIAAYTGTPGTILTKMKKPDTLDKVFVRDWSVEDFLLNFDAVLDIFQKPKDRWEFIRKRLSHLNVSETKITQVRAAFVENVLLCQLLQQKFNFSAEKTQKLVMGAEKSINIGSIAQGAVRVAEVASLVSPFVFKGS